MENFGRILILLGIGTFILGIVLMIGGKFGLGRLPGDIFFQKGNFTFYFPLVTSILLSIFLTLILNFFFRR
ncbi:hypothetical protein CACET_c17230 [Clostridium aceticum]|uniref:Uncharacterized protein n=1 Tax=Clostridium aceticum TaxID=84022 RepID=A0A0D8ID77_9CLOT|nr:DUF2905 domain-containing protein [Clostridium aceticum]AKL95171.1 hypothetical protein CACET_c17230 [Clostridium aceticum]KJF28044.1 hypothetical protein TZ02_05655 [Clostridium aceticum]